MMRPWAHARYADLRHNFFQGWAN